MASKQEEENEFIELIFESSSKVSPENAELEKLLKYLEGSTKETEQKKQIRQIVEICKADIEKNGDNFEAKKVVIELFTKYNNKKAMKKFLQDVIGKFKLSNAIIKSITDVILGDINNKKSCDIKLCNDLVNFVYIMQNSPNFEYEVTIEHLYPIYCTMFEGFVYHSKSNFKYVSSISEDLFTLMKAVFKQIMLVFNKNIEYINTVSEQYSVRLVVLSHSVLLHDKIVFDLKTKCGLIFTYSFNVIPEMHRKNFKYKECPELEFIKYFNDEECVTLANQKLSVFEQSENVVILYSSILSILPQHKLIEVKVDDEALLCLLYEGLMECAERNTSVPNLIVEISRTLSLMGKHLVDIPKDLIKPLFLEGLSFIWSHIDHFVDSVRNYTRLFFEDIVNTAAHHREKEYTELADILLDNVKQLSPMQTTAFLAIENIALHMGSEYLLENFECLPDKLLNTMLEPTISEQVCKTYIFIMEKHYLKAEKETWVRLWVAPVTKLLKNFSQSTQMCQRIITSAFQLYHPVLRKIFPNDYFGNTQECGVLLKCLQYARHQGIELTVETKENSSLYWRGLIGKEKLEKFMIHQNEEVRILALASMIESQKTTEMFVDWEFQYLLNYIRYNITSQIPCFRKQVIALYKKGLARYNAGLYVIVRNIAYMTKKLEVLEDKQETFRILRVYQELRTAYRQFIQKFIKQLIGNLTFDANYARRSTSLELLLAIHKFMPTCEWLASWTEDDVKNCHNIVFDSYESNKKLAVMLLKYLPPKAMGFTNVEFTFKYMQRCLNMALDIKPSKTLSAAYLLQVCSYSPHFYDIVQYGNNEGLQRQRHDSTLDMLVVLTGKLITQNNVKVDIPNTKTAHYGILLSIRHLLENRDTSKNNEAFSGLFDHLVTICLNLKHEIMPIVCNPSPEGFLPDSADEMCLTDESAKAQAVLVYAWRTVKEMTLLLAELVKQTIQVEHLRQMLSVDFMLKIGKWFVEIFVESKHRGVFEQAYFGFSIINAAFWMSSNPLLNRLPSEWLRDALCLCTGEKQSDKLNPTRRSAGLPFLILSILTTETAFDRPKFHEVMKILLKVCENLEEANNEYRIHCLNVLRALYRHSKLGEAVSSYIGAGVKVAITGFKSDTWGVRNSATLLYASLMTRMFGVQRTHDSEDLCMKNRLTINVFFLRYPDLFQFLLESLEKECEKRDSQILHPILMILARLYPAHFENYNSQIERCLPFITRCLSHPNYKTRDLAARASVPLLNQDQIRIHLAKCFSRMKEGDTKDNECHGLLLQAWHILKSTPTLPDVPLTSYINNSMSILQHVGKKFSHLTVSLYMEVLMLFLVKITNFDDLYVIKEILMLLSKQITFNVLPITSMSKFPQDRLLLFLYIAVTKLDECDATYPTITNQIMSLLYGHDVEMKRFCLYLLIYLNQLQHDTGSKHALFIMEEMQIPPQIVNAVDNFEKNAIRKILTHIHPYLKCFLTEEIRFQHYIKKEDQVLLFLLVNYYPCVIKYLNLSKQETLNMLINFCHCDNEELISAVVSCISRFLLLLDYSVLKYDQLIQVLVESASPAASEFRRLTVCDFLSKNYILYCNEEPILVGDELQMVLNVVMVLLEDEELTVRNAMSNFATNLKVQITLNKRPKQTISGHKWPLIPEKTKEDLLTLGSIVLPKEGAICFIFSWACRHFPDSSTDTSEVFERGELNLYAENVPFMDYCVELLHKLLWRLEDGLNYDDRSIFLEEHTLMVTTVLLDSLLKNPSPMMLYKTKVSVICALKSTIKFLERVQINNNFVNEFKEYLNETIVGYLTKHVEHSDLFFVKKIMRDIYAPVLNYKRRRRS